MALKAGVTSIWANYKEDNSELYAKLLEISHWTETDFIKEKEIKSDWKALNMKPDFEIHNFEELINFI